VIRRIKVLGIGLLLGVAFSLWTAGPLMPSGMGLADRASVWASVMGGPVVGTAWGMAEFHPTFFVLGWLGLPLALAHPVRPQVATACLTIIGLVLWFFAGFLAMIVAVYGG
jgi:hypothetical protein